MLASLRRARCGSDSRQAGPAQCICHRPAGVMRLAFAAATPAVLAPGVLVLVSPAPVPCTARSLAHRAAWALRLVIEPHGQRDPLTGLIYAEHLHLDHVAGLGDR